MSSRITRGRFRFTAPHPAGQRRVACLVLTLALLAGGTVGAFMGAGLSPRPASAQDASNVQTAVISAAQGVGPSVVSIRTDQGLGSGVVYDASGLVLTNNHVVQGANTISVGLVDGRHFPGTVLGADPGFDLAVIKMTGQNLPAAQLGDSSALQPGQFVVAIGNPYGFDHTVTVGVVSAVDRPISEGQGSYNQPMVQTDAAINPGNSGGPLVNLQGQVVGINTLIAAPEGVPAQGLGFAIPINTAKRVAPQLAQGALTHSGQAYLGLSLADIIGPGTTPGVGRSGPQAPVPTGVTHGALVTQVLPNGPAAQAGLQTGDVILAFDGRDIYASDDLLQRLVLHSPGDQIPLVVDRGGQTMNLTITVGEAPVLQQQQ